MVILTILLAATVGSAAPHPRLVADADDFKALSVRLEKSELGRAARARLLREADAQLDAAPLVSRKDASGTRILHVSRAAIDRIAKAAMAFRLSGDARYAQCAIREARNVSAFTDWNPSHFLDTAEMTLAVAICYDWLYDRLSEDDREALSRAILRKGLVDGKGELRTGWWNRGHNNWAQVCHGGLGAGAIATAERNPEITRRVIDRAVRNLPVSMGAFAPDGGFPEGPTGYWPYAMEYNALALWAIEKYDGTDHGLSSLPGFAAAVEYLDACTGPTHATFNYSDAGSYSLARRGTDFPPWWLARRFKRPDTLVFHELDALRRYIGSPIGSQPTKRSFNRFYPFLLLCLDEPPADAKIAAPLARVIGGANPIAVMRTSWTDPDAWYAGLKGGSPSCSHGHMDLGSFVLEADGVRWVRDLGCETYAKIEASPVGRRLWSFAQDSPRWSLFRYATQGHGTLQFNDEQQNVRAKADFSPLQTGGATSTRLDLSAAYGRKVLRTFALGGGGGFTVRDEISAARPGDRVTWRVNTCAEVRVEGNCATLTAKNEAGRESRMRVTASPDDVVFTVVDRSEPAHDYELANPGLKQLTFTRTVPDSGALSLSVSFELPRK